jgi:hypothetical protein
MEVIFYPRATLDGAINCSLHSELARN